MKTLTRHQFEHIAYHYVGMAEFSGYHSTGGVWVYNHNYVNNAWKMWQEFQKLSDERLSDRENEIRAEYTYLTPPEQTIRTQQSTIDSLTEQLNAAAEENAKLVSDKYPFAHIRIDCSEYERDLAIRNKLIELGWTPPAKIEAKND